MEWCSCARRSAAPTLPVRQSRCVCSRRRTRTAQSSERLMNWLPLGADVRISYDTSLTRLHAKSLVFHRSSGYSTAYIGSSNLTYSAQVTGLEWNVRLSEPVIPMLLPDRSRLRELLGQSRLRSLRPSRVPTSNRGRDQRTRTSAGARSRLCCAPFQEELLDALKLARHHGHHRNLLVSANRYGKGRSLQRLITHSSAPGLSRDRLLFVAHREEILDPESQPPFDRRCATRRS